jgi:hypothetical protein
MESWWDGLTSLNRGFFASAVFFSVLSLWQTLSALLGFGGHSHGGTGHVASHAGAHEVHGHGATVHQGGSGHQQASHANDRVAFSFVSIRSFIAFGTLFTWAGALYLVDGVRPGLAMVYATLWGIGAMLAVSYLLYRLMRLQEIGRPALESAVGEIGTVYIPIPPDGHGQVRVTAGGRIQYLKARTASREQLVRGTKVRVIDVTSDHLLDVDVLEGEKGG